MELLQYVRYVSVMTDLTVLEFHAYTSVRMQRVFADQLQRCMLATGAQHEPDSDSNVGVFSDNMLGSDQDVSMDLQQ